LRTGVAAIDEEHDALLKLHARLDQCCSELQTTCSNCTLELRVQCGSVLFDIYEDLLSLMSEHFSHEESLMTQCPPEWVLQHKYEHAEISTKLTEYLYRSPLNSHLVAPKELSDLILAWIEDHIMHWDIPLAHLLMGSSASNFSADQAL
jgi:hemerythrin-like metal-binding protein